MQQTFLGDEAFINQVQKHISQKQSDSIHVTNRSKKSPKKPIDKIVQLLRIEGME